MSEFKHLITQNKFSYEQQELILDTILESLKFDVENSEVNYYLSQIKIGEVYFNLNNITGRRKFFDFIEKTYKKQGLKVNLATKQRFIEKLMKDIEIWLNELTKSKKKIAKPASQKRAKIGIQKALNTFSPNQVNSILEEAKLVENTTNPKVWLEEKREINKFTTQIVDHYFQITFSKIQKSLPANQKLSVEQIEDIKSEVGLMIMNILLEKDEEGNKVVKSQQTILAISRGISSLVNNFLLELQESRREIELFRDNQELLGFQKDSFEEIIQEDNSEFIQKVLSQTLYPREQEVIGGRFYESLTLDQLGEFLNKPLSRERMRQIEIKALRKLRLKVLKELREIAAGSIVEESDPKKVLQAEINDLSSKINLRSCLLSQKEDFAKKILVLQEKLINLDRPVLIPYQSESPLPEILPITRAIWLKKSPEWKKTIIDNGFGIGTIDFLCKYFGIGTILEFDALKNRKEEVCKILVEDAKILKELKVKTNFTEKSIIYYLLGENVLKEEIMNSWILANSEIFRALNKDYFNFKINPEIVFEIVENLDLKNTSTQEFLIRLEKSLEQKESLANSKIWELL